MIGKKENKNFYVITGGPGAGKTTVLEELKNRHYQIVPEIARELIKEQQAHNGNALPWKDKELYKETMFDLSISSFDRTDRISHGRKPIFFDRGFLDTICYAILIQSEIDVRMESFARNWRYNRNVFMLPPWREIYATDRERKQSWEEAILTFGRMCEIYIKYGYDIVEIPKTSVSERADFILKYIEEKM